MGFRRVSEAEFKYMKELIKKNKRDLKKVAALTNRSYSLMTYIAKAKTFDEYCGIRPGGKKYQPNKRTKKTSISENIPVKVKYRMNEDTKSILHELRNVRKATFALCGEMKKLANPTILVKQSLPIPEPKQLELDCEQEKRHPILTFLFGLIVVGLVVWVVLMFS